MTVAEIVAEKVSILTPDKQREVLDFVEALEQQAPASRKLIDPHGMWAGQGCEITPEDIAEARKEMWGRLQDD